MFCMWLDTLCLKVNEVCYHDRVLHANRKAATTSKVYTKEHGCICMQNFTYSHEIRIFISLSYITNHTFYFYFVIFHTHTQTHTNIHSHTHTQKGWRGWRHGTAVKGTSRGPMFKSQHPHDRQLTSIYNSKI